MEKYGPIGAMQVITQHNSLISQPLRSNSLHFLENGFISRALLVIYGATHINYAPLLNLFEPLLDVDAANTLDLIKNPLKIGALRSNSGNNAPYLNVDAANSSNYW